MKQGEWDKCFQSPSPPPTPTWVSAGGKGEVAASYCQTTSIPEGGGWSFGEAYDALEMSVWGRMFQGYYLNSFDSSETFIAPGLKKSFQGPLADSHAHQ